MSGEEENMMEEPEEVTRCVCGNVDLKLEDEDEDTGLFVQCDKCLVWQHGYCVGLLNDSQVPETYFCELCRPDLHRLIQRPRKLLRSKFLGVDNASSPPNTSIQPDDTIGILEETETSSSRKRRSTMNSRDAAYDRQLEAALLLSAQQNGTSVEMPAPSVSGRSSRARRQSPTLSKRGRTPSPSPSREEQKQKRRRKGTSAQSRKEESTLHDDQVSVSSTRRRGGGKKKAAGNNSANVAEVEEGTGQDTGNPPSSSSSRPRSANADRLPTASVNNDSRPPSRMASRESTPAPTSTTAARKRGSARNPKKAAPAAVSRGNTVTSVVAPSTPSSGRITAMSEMRKRASAILEAVGRMQEEMATELTEWSQFVPQEEFAALESKQVRDDSVWGYGYSEGGSVKLMENLTGSLLRWESLYG